MRIAQRLAVVAIEDCCPHDSILSWIGHYDKPTLLTLLP
jgi:hypothetical protein